MRPITMIICVGASINQSGGGGGGGGGGGTGRGGGGINCLLPMVQVAINSIGMASHSI